MNISAETVNDFFHSVYLDNDHNSYDPSITFWNLELEQRNFSSFSKFCLVNSPSPLILNLEKNNVDQVNGLINELKIYHGELNYEMYSIIIDSGLQYNADLVGFGIANQIGTMFSILPIIEISGQDADTINNLILLVS